MDDFNCTIMWYDEIMQKMTYLKCIIIHVNKKIMHLFVILIHNRNRENEEIKGKLKLITQST